MKESPAKRAVQRRTSEGGDEKSVVGAGSNAEGPSAGEIQGEIDQAKAPRSDPSREPRPGAPAGGQRAPSASSLLGEGRCDAGGSRHSGR